MSAALSSPAALRNRGPILERLRALLPPRGLVLEIASGTGEHAVHFASALPGLEWQPSDPSAEARASIAAHAAEARLPNLRPPLALDAQAWPWPVAHADAVLAVNLVHISPWEATLGLLDGAARVLPEGGVLLLYGPYLEEGVPTAPSNLAFDADLKARDPRWGLRRREAVEEAALGHGLAPAGRFEMPANNLLLGFRRS
jgi:SAM-dependent methyltransferase